MLLHIFHVDTGTMMKFDINLALENVSKLKEEIEQKCGITCDKQVLLASGGQNLEPTERVGTYFAGTDTSPIFLFSKTSIENSVPPIPTVDYGPDPEMKEDVSASLNLPATTNTVRIRSLLAQRLCDLAKEQLKICENLVHDQHLQQQGWAAVVANLDDITTLFKSKSENFDQNFKQHLETRDQYIEILDSFEVDIETLNKIPVLPALLETEEGVSENTPLTLLQWISAKDQQASLQQLAEQCRKGINLFDDKILEALMNEVTSAIEAASATEMREIKGLGDRLFGLEKLRCEANDIVREQTDLANAFIQNQNSVTNLGGDDSILPDLCMSHKQQLKVMLENHQKLRGIRHRCVKAKQELATNLFHRLKWVMFVESRIFETDGRLVMYHESVKKLRQHLEVLQQLHTAPSMYLTAVTEVVRRRTFSQAFLQWGSNVSCQVCAVHSEEVTRRKMFYSRFQGHFLSSLFPGLDDLPPPFATHPPPLFDSNLPKLSLEDVESLRVQLPDLALSLSVPDLTSITQFFMTVSKSEDNQQGNSIHKMEHHPGGLSSNLEGTLLQPSENSQSSAQSATQPISDRFELIPGFESETDTEDLENITPCEVPLLKKGRKRKEETELGETKKCNVGDTVVCLKAEMGDLKDWVVYQRCQLVEMFHRLTLSFDEQNQALLNELEIKKSEINNLRTFNSSLEEKLKRSLEREERERCEKERIFEETKKEKLQMQQRHKLELETMKGRFKLYTSTHGALERSISESSLSKGGMAVKSASGVVRDDQFILQNMKIAQEKGKWEKAVPFMLSEHQAQENLIWKPSSCLHKEIEVPEIGTSSLPPVFSMLLGHHSSFQRQEVQPMEETDIPEKDSAPQSLVSSSVVAIEPQQEIRSRDATTSPDSTTHGSKSKDKLIKNTEALKQEEKCDGKFTISSCNEGDDVLIVWDNEYEAYRIFQDSSTLYFLHRDSFDKFSLKDCYSKKQCYTGRVVQREYCQAKKATNRYNVPIDTKFYRVKVEPLGRKKK